MRYMCILDLATPSQRKILQGYPIYIYIYMNMKFNVITDVARIFHMKVNVIADVAQRSGLDTFLSRSCPGTFSLFVYSYEAQHKQINILV